MEIVNIEVATFQKMKMNFSTRIRQIVGKASAKNTEEWLDNQEVCLLLKISPRTLQNLRDNGSIPYTRIERKIFYNKREIWNFIEKRNIQSKKSIDNKLVTKDNPEVQAFFEKLENLLNLISCSFENYTPMLDNERFITDAELSQMIRLSKRTLQEYRSAGKLTYYQLGDKILYKEPDIKKLLESNRMEAFRK